MKLMFINGSFPSTINIIGTLILISLKLE